MIRSKLFLVGPLLISFASGRDADFDDYDIFKCLLWVDGFADHIGFRLTVCNLSFHIRWDYGQ